MYAINIVMTILSLFLITVKYSICINEIFSLPIHFLRSIRMGIPASGITNKPSMIRMEKVFCGMVEHRLGIRLGVVWLCHE